MPSEHDWLRQDAGPNGNPLAIFEIAKQLETAGDFHLAATAYDRAVGLDGTNPQIIQARNHLLEHLAVTDHGIRFVYVPAGTFLMGSDVGDPDEKPAHSVELGHYWLSETPISWAAHCQMAGWEPPPNGLPKGFDWKKIPKGDFIGFLPAANKVRLQYCENATTRARDWHAHIPDMEWKKGDGQKTTSREMFGEVPRENPALPWGYDQKPVIGISQGEIEFLCKKITTARAVYRLPTEAEWEKGARGGLVGKRFPWGNDAPNPESCDFDRFDQFSIQPSRRFSPNGYGLYAMSGGVWEWVSDWYDAEYYSESTSINPNGAGSGNEKVLRGGSWSDCGEVQTVSYRGARAPEKGGTPNIGYRICRVDMPATPVSSQASPNWLGKLSRIFSGT
jgi:sulfatase modifying factor 1